MSTLFISQYRLVEDSSIKPHYVYVVEILHVGKRYSVEKRYSAFHSLHREVEHPFFPSHPKTQIAIFTRALAANSLAVLFLKFAAALKFEFEFLPV